MHPLFSQPDATFDHKDLILPLTLFFLLDIQHTKTYIFVSLQLSGYNTIEPLKKYEEGHRNAKKKLFPRLNKEAHGNTKKRSCVSKELKSFCFDLGIRQVSR